MKYCKIWYALFLKHLLLGLLIFGKTGLSSVPKIAKALGSLSIKA